VNGYVSDLELYARVKLPKGSKKPRIMLFFNHEVICDGVSRRIDK